jgi:hypothetical protein
VLTIPLGHTTCASGKDRLLVTRNSEGEIRDRAMRNLLTRHDRPREAIECLKRALIATGPHDTSIHLKLAQFHNDLEEYSEAAKYHASVINICSSDSELSPSLVVVIY